MVTMAHVAPLCAVVSTEHPAIQEHVLAIKVTGNDAVIIIVSLHVAGLEIAPSCFYLY